MIATEVLAKVNPIENYPPIHVRSALQVPKSVEPTKSQPKRVSYTQTGTAHWPQTPVCFYVSNWVDSPN